MATGSTCECGHALAAHEHYRTGSDCSLCDCPRFRDADAPAAGWWTRMLGLFRRH